MFYTAEELGRIKAHVQAEMEAYRAICDEINELLDKKDKAAGAIARLLDSTTEDSIACEEGTVTRYQNKGRINYRAAAELALEKWGHNDPEAFVENFRGKPSSVITIRLKKEKT